MSKKLRILIIRLSSIGDIILSTPVIRHIKLELDAEVHFVVKKSFHAILVNNPYIDQIHLLEDDMGAFIKKLNTFQFDYIIDLHKNIRSKRIVSGISGKAFSVDKQNIQKWKMVHFKSKTEISPIVERYLSTLDELGIQGDGEGLDYFYTKEQIEPIEDRVGISIGATHSTKRLPRNKLLEICHSIKQPIVLLGGTDVSEDAYFIIENFKGKIPILNQVGKTSLNQTANYVDQLKLLITYDTALMHMRAAFKKPQIVIWGNTIPEFGMGPYYGNYIVPFWNLQVNGLTCRPCSKIGYKTCPKKHFKCMEDQDFGRINMLISQFYG